MLSKWSNNLKLQRYPTHCKYNWQ